MVNVLSYITKLYKLPRATGSAVEVPNLTRVELAKIFAKFGFTKGAQVGVWDGAYTKMLCAANPKLTLFGIDINSKTDRKAVPSNCRLVRSKSQDAAKRVVDGSLDFVYLDTNADFPSLTNDIHTWSKKVRSGGIIAGYDYFRYRARAQRYTYQAVNAYTNTYHISPWFVLGRGVDPVRSWFWIKA